ncbi:MAG TPA: signal peptidase II [Candidatus Limnocylindrales bacterium]
MRSAPVGTRADSVVERRRPHWGLFVGLAAAVLIADQVAKAWIVANVDPFRPTTVVGDYLRLILSHNTGALFGLFHDQAALFAIFSVVVIGLLVWYQSKVGRSVLLSIALGLLLGGAIGNLSDRVRLGYVVDFVDAGIGSLRFYTFNIADAAISTALLLLILVALRPSLGGPPDREPGTDA